MEHHAEVLKDGVGRQRIPNWRDLVVIVLAVLVLTGTGVRQVVASLTVAQQPGNSLSPIALLLYVVRIAVRGQER